MTEIKILYEDNHLLGIEKPENMPIQADASRDGDVLTLLKKYIKEKYHKPGEVFLGLVHRLDRPVGGAMIFAKTSKAASRLSEQIRSRKMEKIYLAVAEGTFSSREGSYHDYLLKDRDTNIVRVVPKNTDGSQEAILSYSVISEHEGNSLVIIRLETGRPHQIRVQFSNDGHPLAGDGKYGRTGTKGYTGNLALWSFKLAVKHPVRDELVQISSIPPNHGPWIMFSEEIREMAREIEEAPQP